MKKPKLHKCFTMLLSPDIVICSKWAHRRPLSFNGLAQYDSKTLLICFLLWHLSFGQECCTRNASVDHSQTTSNICFILKYVYDLQIRKYHELFSSSTLSRNDHRKKTKLNCRSGLENQILILREQINGTPNTAFSSRRYRKLVLVYRRKNHEFRPSDQIKSNNLCLPSPSHLPEPLNKNKNDSLYELDIIK